MKATMESFYAGADSYDRAECEVVIRSGTVVVSYEDEGGPTIWRGDEVGTGHYELQCPELKGRATLHRMSDESATLEGSWIEDGEFGMWRIDLEE